MVSDTRKRTATPQIKTKEGLEVPFTIGRAHQYLAEQCRRDVLKFGQFMFGHIPGPHHEKWFEAIFDWRNNRILIVSSREFGKTMTMLTAILWYIGHNPNTTNVITSVSSDQAKQRLGNIREIIGHNPRYKLVFPWVEIDPRKPWTNSEINVWDRRVGFSQSRKKRNEEGTSNTPSLFAMGMGGKGLVGNRISGFAVVDDPHDEDAAFSPTTRQRAIDWYYRTFINCLLVNAKAIIITTRWHQEDLAGDIIDTKIGGYKILNTPAETIDENGKRISNWPAVWPLERLDAKRAGIGDRMYGALYLNDVNALKGVMFEAGWLRNELPRPVPPMKKIIISVDPAVTVKRRSDYTCIALCGVDAKKNFYCMRLINRKLHPKDLSIVLERMFHEAKQEFGRCDVIIVEKAAQQKLIVDRILAETTLPIRGFAAKGDKKTKAQALASLANAGRFYAGWSETWGKPLRSQLLAFDGRGNATHDDMVDAIAQAANYLLGRQQVLNAGVKKVQVPYLA